MKLHQNTTVNHNEGLFFIDLNDLLVYRKKRSKDVYKKGSDLSETEKEDYMIDVDKSQTNYDEFKKMFCDTMQTHCKSLGVVDTKGKNRSQIILLENKICQIVFEDNQWGIAVKILRQGTANPGIADQTFGHFIRHTKNALLQRFPEIYVRNGSWSVLPVTQNTPLEFGNQIVEPETI